MTESQQQQIIRHTAAGRTWLSSAELSGVPMAELLQVVLHAKQGRDQASMEFFAKLKQAGAEASANNMKRQTRRCNRAS